MALPLPVRVLSSKHLKRIKNELSLKTELSFTEKQMKVKPKTLKCFRLHQKTYYLPYHYVCKNFADTLQEVEFPEDELAMETDIKYEGFNLWKYQQKYYNQAIRELRTRGTTIMALRTAAGKTVLGTKLICATKRVTLILVPRINLGVSWYRTVFRNTDAAIWLVNMKYRKKTVPKPKEPDVIICNIGSFGKLGNIIKDVGTLVIDECHMFYTQLRANKILSLCPDYVIALSATPKNKPGWDNFIGHLCGKINIELEMKIPHNTYKVYTGITYTADPDSKNIWDATKKYYFGNVYRNERICELIEYLTEDPEAKIFAVTWDVKSSIDKIEKVFKRYKLNYSLYYGSMKTYADATTTLATIAKAGVGFDQNEDICPDWDERRFNKLILIGSTTDPSLYAQIVGRVARANNFEVYYIVDDNKIIKRHFGSCKKWEKTHGGSIYDVDLSDPHITISEAFSKKRLTYQYIEEEEESSEEEEAEELLYLQ